MWFRQLGFLLLTPVLLLGLSSCGGVTQVAGGGIGGTGISQGIITAFGSIWVNGVEFNTTNAAITRDGAPSTQNDLRIGMVVTVEGTVNPDGVSGTALTVSYGKNLEGPVGANDHVTTLAVLGQTVVVDKLTKIAIGGIIAPTINDLNLNQTVEVSGFIDANGTLHATYIEAKQQGPEYELEGVISAVTGNLITIGELVVDITHAANNFGGQGPSSGDYVEVKGNTLVGNSLTATRIERKSRALGKTDAEHAEIEGLVTSLVSTVDFFVGGQSVQTNAQTLFEGGLAADVRVGAKLEVKGALANGVLVATKVQFEEADESEGDVASLAGDSINESAPATGLTEGGDGVEEANETSIESPVE